MPRAARTAHDYRDPSSFRSKWRERAIILPEGLVEHLFKWHGGQSTAAYALASTGMRELVSLSMIDAAVSELEAVESKLRSREKKELGSLLDDLQTVRHFWKEHDAREAGMDVKKYEYDHADYGMTAKDEDAIEVRSG